MPKPEPGARSRGSFLPCFPGLPVLCPPGGALVRGQRLEAPRAPAALCCLSRPTACCSPEIYHSPSPPRPCRAPLQPLALTAVFQAQSLLDVGHPGELRLVSSSVSVSCSWFSGPALTWGPMGLDPHLNADTHPQMEPRPPHCGPSSQRSSSCGSCLHPSPRQQTVQPTPSPAQPAAHHPSPPCWKGATEWTGKLGGSLGGSIASWSALGWSPVSNTASNYLEPSRVSWAQNCPLDLV